MPLFDRQMLFVTGKGGVGKTTVAAALALAAHREGRRTIVCEVGGQGRIPALLGAPSPSPHVETPIEDGLSAISIVSWRVLEEWIGKMLGSRALTSVLTRSNFFRAFAEAAPGGMELGTIVKTWELAQRERWDRRHPRYDLVIVDGPASGHAVGMLRTPATFHDIARVGPIASQSGRVRDWLADEARTAYVGVALPGELPVSETLDLDARLRAQLHRGLETVIVNGMLPDRFSAKEVEQVRRAAKDPLTVEAVRAAHARATQQRAHVRHLDRHIGAAVRELPFVFSAGLGREDVEALADRLPVA